MQDRTVQCHTLKIDYNQLYAQLKTEILSGERTWFTTDEEAEIQQSNLAFYKQNVEEELFFSGFRPAEKSGPANFFRLLKFSADCANAILRQCVALHSELSAVLYLRLGLKGFIRGMGMFMRWWRCERWFVAKQGETLRHKDTEENNGVILS